MEETIITINGPNLLTLALMIFTIFAVAYIIMNSAAKMRGGSND